MQLARSTGNDWNSVFAPEARNGANHTLSMLIHHTELPHFRRNTLHDPQLARRQRRRGAPRRRSRVPILT